MRDKKQQIIDLWKICFNDSNEFMNLFFQCIYKEENALVIKQGEEIVSALQLLPYKMNYQGLDIPISYIYGVCTKTSERNKGLMHQLLQNAFEEALWRGDSLVVLIPAEPWNKIAILGALKISHFVTLFPTPCIKTPGL